VAVDAHVEIGQSYNFELRHAVLVYGDQHHAFATLHEVAKQEEGAPMLGPALPLSLAFLRELAHGLGSQVVPEVFPTNVLARTPERIVWWSQAARLPMFFGAADEGARKLNGGVFPHPPLVFKVCGGELFVRALQRNTRPEGTTWLMNAPYWNVGGDGRVCLGTARAPKEASVASIPAWQDAFHRSQFTHALGAVRLTTHRGGFVGLWRSLAGKKRFPGRCLSEARETLRDFAIRER
jgi:PRTRC genetic system protein B